MPCRCTLEPLPRRSQVSSVSQLRDRMEGLERHSLECEGLASCVNNRRLSAHVAVSFREKREVLAERRIERGGRLYLRGEELSAGVWKMVQYGKSTSRIAPVSRDGKCNGRARTPRASMPRRKIMGKEARERLFLSLQVNRGQRSKSTANFT